MAALSLAQYVLPGRVVGRTGRLFRCVAARDMYLKDLCDSVKMNGVSLTMGDVIIHRITRGSAIPGQPRQQFPALGNFEILRGDWLLFSVAERSEIRIKVDEDFRATLNRCLIFSAWNDCLEFKTDLEGVSRSLDHRRQIDEMYTITKGSFITRIDTEEDKVLPQCFHERLSQNVPIDAFLTVSFDPLDRLKRHVTNVEEAQHVALWNEVKLTWDQLSRVGPNTDALPGRDVLREAGLPLTYQLNDQSNTVSMVGPATQIEQVSTKFLVFCDAYVDYLPLVCREFSQKGTPLCCAALSVFRDWSLIDNYAPCLFARDGNQDIAEVLSPRSSWTPFHFGMSVAANLERDLNELIATYEGLPQDVISRILAEKIRRLQARGALA